MLDVQKERLRQMMANAILELWKKETGSLASVFIEATVCITSCNNRMTVIQLSDHFPGLIPEPPSILSMEKMSQLHSPGNVISRIVSHNGHTPGQKRKMMENFQDRVESSRTLPRWFSSSDGLGAIEKDVVLSTSSVRVLEPDQMDSNNNQTGIVDAERHLEYREMTDKDDMSSEESDTYEGENAELEKMQSFYSRLGLVCEGTGFYACQKSFPVGKEKDGMVETDANDSAIQDMSSGSLVIDMSMAEDEHTNNSSIPDGKGPAGTPKRHSFSLVAENGNASKDETEALNLKQHDVDLVISPPQNYTEQVRDVIRSRLLNGKQKVTGTKSAGKDHSSIDYFQPSASITAPSLPGDIRGVSLCQPFKASSWPIVKREKLSGTMLDGQMLQRHFSSPPLSLVQMHKSLNSVATSLPIVHQSLHKLFTLGGSMEHANAKVFPKSENESEADDKSAGLAFQYSDQKLCKFDGTPDSVMNNAEQKTYRCSFCHKTFLFKSKYHEHLPVHTSARPFQCHMCTRTYKYKYDLRVHLRTHLGIPTKSTICPFCSGKFLTNKLLRHHIKEAHREQQQISEEQCAQSLENVPSCSPVVSSV